MKLKNRRSQITIFIIIALIIVVLIALAFSPVIKRAFVPQKPIDMIPRACVEDAVRESLNITMLHGGSVKPALYFRYNNETLDYLCYTSEWYTTCAMQKPFLKQSIEQESLNYAQANLSRCLSDMEEGFRSAGYTVSTNGNRKASISIIPEKIAVDFNMTITLRKGEETIPLNPAMMHTEFKSNAYEIIMVASSIQNYEARLGDSVPESYMSFYPNLRIEKKKCDDGTKVYIITDRNTGEKLQFATRSLAWPPGYYLP